MLHNSEIDDDFAYNILAYHFFLLKTIRNRMQINWHLRSLVCIFANTNRFIMGSYSWNDLSKRLLKAELVKRGISHEELAKRLNDIGNRETKSSVDSKICRGTFSASFLLQCLNVIGCNNLVIENQLLAASEPNYEYGKSIENEAN